MTLRWWYLRRGVAWSPVLACCVAAVAAAGVLARWPSAAIGLLPVLLACCAGAAAFVFDEAATEVVSVTPRGGSWRRAARVTVAGVPLALWALVVLVRPGDLPLERPGWWLVGAATIVTVAGAAALASRRDVSAPGSFLAAVVVLAVLAPVVVTAFLGWQSVYPIDGFADAAWLFWLAVTVTGAVVWLLALSPSLGT